MSGSPLIILASVSPRRRQLMKEGGYRFNVVPSDVVERAPNGLLPHQLVKFLALKKAMAVAKKFPDHPVLGADTLVFINGHVVGKPRHPHHARTILRELSGQWQSVYTGVAVVWEGGRRSAVEVAHSKVKMRILTDADIERAAHEHLDKAGAYAVQEKKDPFVESIIGDYDNVVGLPMRVVKRLLGW